MLSLDRRLVDTEVNVSEDVRSFRRLESLCGDPSLLLRPLFVAPSLILLLLLFKLILCFCRSILARLSSSIAFATNVLKFSVLITSVTPSVHSTTVPHRSIGNSKISGTASTNCLIPAFPKARVTARIPSTRAEPSLDFKIFPPMLLILVRSSSLVGRWSGVSKTILLLLL